MNNPERTVTVRVHVPWDAESSERLYAVCRTQDACWNLALDYLIEHSEEPLRKSKRLGVKGLQGRWLEWREDHEWAKNVPQAIWRGGVLRAKEQVERWEAVNESHGNACLKALEDGKDIPRRVQRRHASGQGWRCSRASSFSRRSCNASRFTSSPGMYSRSLPWITMSSRHRLHRGCRVG